jgi:hypothetical protein
VHYAPPLTPVFRGPELGIVAGITLKWIFRPSSGIVRCTKALIGPLCLGASVFASVLATSACQGDYPLAPTRCDNWCQATQRAGCAKDWPDTCILDCENLRLVPPGEDCARTFDKLVACYAATPTDHFSCQEGRSVPSPEDCQPQLFDMVLFCRGRR